MIRIQLAIPHNHFFRRRSYNRLFTMHGTTMVFFVGMPILFGIANYLVPLMIGARDMAFPRLNALSFWMTLFGGLLSITVSSAARPVRRGTAPDVGWFAYAPLTAHAFSRRPRTDYWALGLIVSGFGSIGAAVNIIATIFCMRCQGMTLREMPFFVWLMLCDSWSCSCRHLAPHRRPDHAAHRPLPGRAFLRHTDRRLGDTVAALLLDLRPPGGLRPDSAGFAIVNEIIPVFSRKADLRLPGHGGGHGRPSPS